METKDKKDDWSTRDNYKYVAIDHETHAIIRRLADEECRNLGKQLRWIVRTYDEHLSKK